MIVNSVTNPDVAPALDVTATIDLSDFGHGPQTYQFRASKNRTVNGPTLPDNGLITVNSNQSGTSVFSVTGTISGTGSIVLDSVGGSANLAGTFTQSAGHTIAGLGEVSGAVTNNGTVDADSSGQILSLDTNNKTNNGTMEATGGGILNISGMPILQIHVDASTVLRGALSHTK